MVSGYGKVVGMAKIKLKIFDLIRNVFVFVLDTADFSHDFLIGLDLIKEFKLCQDEKLNIFQKRNGRGIFCLLGILRSENLACVNCVQLKADLYHLDPLRSSSVNKVIQKFNYAFAKNKFDVGKVSAHEAAVRLLEHHYMYCKPYRCNIIDQKEIESDF